MHKYIDAEALREKILLRANEKAAKLSWDNYSGGYWAGLIYAKWLLENMPVADVKLAEHGQWECKYGYYHCSTCNYPAFHEFWNYCPNCGAAMNGGSE